MPVLVENLMCFLGLSLCAMLYEEQSQGLLFAIVILFCLGQIVICENQYGKMKFKQVLSYESVYLMTNFLFALVFRLILRASVLDEKSAYAGFMFYLWFSAVHWVYIIIRLIIKRRIEGPTPKDPKKLRYGLIRDEDVEDTL